MTARSNRRILQITHTREWLRRAGSLLCLLTVLLASGAHTLAIQSYGWLRMFDAYNENFSVSTSLEMTFSGEELCGICVLSQESLTGLENNLSLALEDQKSPLSHSDLKSLAIQTPPSTRLTFPDCRNHPYQEIKTEFDPPPPRLA